MLKLEIGRCIILHRLLKLPDVPSSEAGPAAIVSRGNMCSAGVGSVARDIQSGGGFWEWAGGRKGVEQCVTVRSPSLPGLEFMTRFLGCEIDWREWFGGPAEMGAADVVLVFQTSRVLRPRMTLDRAAEYLVASAFGSGGVYHATQITQLAGLARAKECPQGSAVFSLDPAAEIVADPGAIDLNFTAAE